MLRTVANGATVFSCLPAGNCGSEWLISPIVLGLDNGFRFIAYPDSDVSAGFIYYRIPDARETAFFAPT
jgi:hypothetical protein